MTGPFGLKGETAFKGAGIHTGTPSEVLVAPFEGPGFFFSLGGSVYPVESASADGTARGTTLTFPDGSRVMTVEHLLGALAGLGIWSALLTVSGPEIPAMDGSAGVFAEALIPLREPGLEVDPITVAREIAFGYPRGGYIGVIPSEGFEIACSISYGPSAIGTQVYEGSISDDVFAEEIAPARTFVLASEIEGIRERGLGLGGSAENVLVIGDGDPPSPSKYRVPSEPVRHKILDLIGDLATLGRPLKGRVIAHRAGHRMHLELVRRIRRSLLLH
ncbi:MAG: UDP-3-O-acyl-N-acetylglucosamine deacetylase [Synergistales bacterium]|jgi:UDP-3-O-[3-hydroxymyristoyl] N-acetylglucosamine deacetylase|nr:UDP-3-O-acyl-N-acetylglucosamine deacetylase [Synergistales bacterium]HOC82831.1 UDP-3-O-acyl-N-acetylglucosamine deacetylase [Synergistales bacterium]HQL02986.1 UDP-3-O-acyl-N-acetylglucosamine deacetylase [Synergistales bacterium]